VIVLGHSAGAHLAALAALAGDHFRAHCPYPPVRIDGLVGLSGPYDVVLLPDVAYPLFGVRAADAPATWREGDPMTWLTQRTDLPVLLAHGGADSLLPPAFTRTFADALRAAGHPVEVSIVPGADHNDMFAPKVIADTVIAWIDSLVSAAASS
jgi:acetyl esterase/lipase